MKPAAGINQAPGLSQVIAMRQQLLDRSAALQSLHGNQTPEAAPIPNAAPNAAPNALIDTHNAAVPAPSAATSFTDTLSNALDEVSAAQNRSAKLAAAYERGEVTDIAQVMLARQESGVAFEATLQVRNKLLSAYQDIMRMGA
jgi:flagellar hook-basal body complex protein FliE